MKSNIRTTIFSVLLLVVTLLIYANGLNNDFVYDDGQVILNNKWITDVRYIPEIVSSTAWGFSQMNQHVSNFYRPMIHIFFMVDYHIFGFNSWGFHLISILFHAFISILVFLIVHELCNLADGVQQRDNLSYAFIAALLFAAHPVHTEVVSWISARPDLGFTFFCLLSFYLYIRSHSVTSLSFIFSVCFFFLSLLTKETATALLFFIALHDFLLKKRERFILFLKAAFKRYLPYLLAFLLYLSLRTFVLGRFASINTAYADLAWFQIPFNSLALLAKYFITLLLPFNLNIFHAFDPIRSIGEPVLIFSLLFFASILYVLYISFTKKPLVFVNLIWIIIPLLPVLYIPFIGENPFTERYLYLSSVGFVSLIAVGMKEVAIVKRNILKYLMFVVFVVAALYAAGTINRNTVWQSDLTLWGDAVAKSPLKAATHIALGNTYERNGSLDRALAEFKIATNVEKSSWKAQRNIGRVYRKMGMIEKSIYHYKEALRLNPFSAVTRNDLGGVYGMEGRYVEAINEFQQALALDPDLEQAKENLQKALRITGE